MAKKSTKGKRSPAPAGLVMCRDCLSPSQRAACRDCVQARKQHPTSLLQARLALYWRVQKASGRLTPGQVNYVMHEHWTSLNSQGQRELEVALAKQFGPTQTAYEALLYFGLCELNKRKRLSDFPKNLRELRRVQRHKISREEVKKLDGIVDQVVEGSKDSDVVEVQCELTPEAPEAPEAPAAPAAPGGSPSSGVARTGVFVRGSTWLVGRLHALARRLWRVAKPRSYWRF